tara:strand:+ start:1095 stop:1574 length:480 start_codon:yes stop_codon:yes gene_type:complete
MKLKVFRLRPQAKLPHRAHPTDAGCDVFYCHRADDLFTSDSIDDRGNIIVYPNTTCLIPTGIKVEFASNHMLEVKNKSGIASKKNLVVGACVIDHLYDGEVYINLHNIGKVPRIIEPGQKVAQVVLVPISTCEVEEVFEDNLNQGTARSEGGFGSTGDF